MGNCNCTTNTDKEKLSQIIHEQTQTSSTPKAVQAEHQTQKKRAKVALLVNHPIVDCDDNVTFLPPETIAPHDLVEIKKTLKRHFIFSQLSEKEVECFLSELRPCKADKGEYVFKQGDKSGSYYIILEGTCQIQINNEKKKTLTFGDSFGDLGVIYSAPRSASVLTLTKCYFVEMNRKIFKKVMEDINAAYEQQNKKFLGVLSFFKDLTQQQKNAIASTCLSETYQEGQIIFTQGDDANSFYIIKQGIVTIKEKNIDLKPMDSFGQNSILVEGGKRTNTLVAKSKCKILSMSRQNIQSSLGGSIKNTLRKNMVWKIVSQSKLYKNNLNLKWKEGLQVLEQISLKKDQMIFKKNQQFKNVVYIVLTAKLQGQSITYDQNSIVELSQLMANKQFTVPQNINAVSDGYVGKLQVDFQQKPTESESQMTQMTKSVKQSTARQNNQKKMMITDFHVVKKLRSGNFGQVYACYNQKTEKVYAIKVLDRSYVEKAQIIQYVMNEQEILRTAPKHPFLVGFYKLIKDTNFIYFIMEYIEGQDLFDTITKMISFNEQKTKFLVSQILCVLQHLHSNKIIYRDLKPENLMMCTNGYLKLVDMGTAKKLKIQRRYRTTTIIGTPHYMAPEIITGKGYSFQVDLWSLGVIMYELLCGKLPFGQYSDDPFTIYEEIINSSIKYPRNCQKNCKVFIEKLLSRSPQHRMGNGYEELKKHAFFEGINWKKLLDKELEPFYLLDQTYSLKKEEIQSALLQPKNQVPDRMVADKSSK